MYGVSFFFFEKKINLNKSLDIYCYSGVSRRVQPVLHSVETIFNWVPLFVMSAIFPILETTSKEIHIPSTSSYESNSKLWTKTATRREDQLEVHPFLPEVTTLFLSLQS